MNAQKALDYWKEFHIKLDEVGIGKGDIVYVGSDITAIVINAIKDLEFTSKQDRTDFMNDLIDELKNHVTEEGTLLFPVYSWAICRGVDYDYSKTQCEVGAFNNFILNNRKDFARTMHPIYSFMVWGKDAMKLTSMNNQEAWGKASPFFYMHQNGAKELDLNVKAVRSMTFKHYVEMSLKVPYRYPKYFLCNYTDENGVREERGYSMYVRDLSVKMKAVEENAFFEMNNSGKTVSFRGWQIHMIDLKKAYDVIKDDLLNNGGKNVYRFENYEIEWNDRKDVYEVGFWKNKDLITH